MFVRDRVLEIEDQLAHALATFALIPQKFKDLFEGFDDATKAVSILETPRRVSGMGFNMVAAARQRQPSFGCEY